MKLQHKSKAAVPCIEDKEIVEEIVEDGDVCAAEALRIIRGEG